MTAIASPGEGNQGSERRGAGKVRFPHSARLLRHADFERVYKQGRRHFSASMTVFYLQRQPVSTDCSKAGAISGFRVGFTVGRALGGAVPRNRMKRRLREAVRLTRPAAGANVDVVINPKKSISATDFAAVVNEVSRAFAAIEHKVGTRPAPVAERSSGSRKPEAGS